MNTKPIPAKRHAHAHADNNADSSDDPTILVIDAELQRNLDSIERRVARSTRSVHRVGLVACLMTVLLAGTILWEQRSDRQVVRSSSAGELQDLRPLANPKGFKPVVLVLRSAEGFISLHEPLNLAPGAALVREERASGREYICDVGRTQCAEIARGSGH